MEKLLLLASVLIIAVTSHQCTDYDLQPSYTKEIGLLFPDGFTPSSVDNIVIKLESTTTGREVTVTTDQTGVAKSLLAEGYYNISTSFDLTVDGDEYTFNGTLSNYMINNEDPLSLDLIMVSNNGGFIFKEIYYSGSKSLTGSNYLSDQFLEIYNNSAEVLYADSLCVGVLQQTSTKANLWVNEDGSFMDRLALTFHVWIVPGTGKDHPVQPGESFIIAQDGINHYGDANGNPNSPVDLSNADWETYCSLSGKDIDASGVSNLTMIYTTSSSMTDWTLSVAGSAVIIFRLPTDWETYSENPDNYMTAPNSTTSTKYFMVDKSYVIDGVEIVSVDDSKRYKRLHDELDAGYTYTEGASGCAKSIRRKVKMIVDGRVIYKDSNNSSNDFLHDLTPTPGVNPTEVEN